MTRRRQVVRRIAKAAKERDVMWVEAREGANHTVFSLDGLMIPIARHREIDEQMAEVIFKECEPKLGKGWWRR